VVETIPCISKGTYKRVLHHLNARAAPNYSVVEYLSQKPCAMFALKVLQRCPSQRNIFLPALGSRISPSFDITSGGKIVSVEVEVVDATIDYNFLLGRSWTYAMTVVVSSVFRVIQFPHEGRIVTIDQLSFTRKNPNSPVGSKISSIDKSIPVIESVGINLYPSIMGTFDFPTRVLFVGSSSDVPEEESVVSVIQSFKTKYLKYPWVLPNPSDTRDVCLYSDSTPLLSVAEIAYQAIQ